MAYRIAGIDVHKRMLAVAVADVAVDGEYQFVRRMVGTSLVQLRALAAWLVEQEVEEVVMESTAQYSAQAQSNCGARERKKDFPDAERLVKRLVAQELILSFVPNGEQRVADGDAAQAAGHG